MEVTERQPAQEAGRKFTLRLGPDAVADLEWLAREYGGITLTDVLKRTVTTEKFLLEQQKSGHIVILEDSRSGRQREIIFR